MKLKYIYLFAFYTIYKSIGLTLSMNRIVIYLLHIHVDILMSSQAFQCFGEDVLKKEMSFNTIMKNTSITSRPASEGHVFFCFFPPHFPSVSCFILVTYLWSDPLPVKFPASFLCGCLLHLMCSIVV